MALYFFLLFSTCTMMHNLARTTGKSGRERQARGARTRRRPWNCWPSRRARDAGPARTRRRPTRRISSRSQGTARATGTCRVAWRTRKVSKVMEAKNCSIAEIIRSICSISGPNRKGEQHCKYYPLSNHLINELWLERFSDGSLEF